MASVSSSLDPIIKQIYSAEMVCLSASNEGLLNPWHGIEVLEFTYYVNISNYNITPAYPLHKYSPEVTKWI
jgi:hypothetical protein